MFFSLLLAALLLSPLMFPKAILGNGTRHTDIDDHPEIVVSKQLAQAAAAPRRTLLAPPLQEAPKVIPRTVQAPFQEAEPDAANDIRVADFDPDEDVLTVEAEAGASIHITGRRAVGEEFHVLLSNGTRLILEGTDRFPDDALRVVPANH